MVHRKVSPAVLAAMLAAGLSGCSSESTSLGEFSGGTLDLFASNNDGGTLVPEMLSIMVSLDAGNSCPALPRDVVASLNGTPMHVVPGSESTGYKPGCHSPFFTAEIPAARLQPGQDGRFELRDGSTRFVLTVRNLLAPRGLTARQPWAPIRRDQKLTLDWTPPEERFAHPPDVFFSAPPVPGETGRDFAVSTDGATVTAVVPATAAPGSGSVRTNVSPVLEVLECSGVRQCDAGLLWARNHPSEVVVD